MSPQKTYTLINKQTGNLAFKLFPFENNDRFDHLQRNNYYSLLWIKEGEGLLKVDFSEHLFEKGNVLAFAPYQPFMISTDKNILGCAIQFHSDFYCIHRNPQETNCNSVLFNNIYEAPILELDAQASKGLSSLIDQLENELSTEQSNNYELVIPHLKILLVTLSRCKLSQNSALQQITKSQTPYKLEELKALLEQNYKSKHSPSEYANLLNISASAFSRLVKQHFHKTPTALITERIIIEAKRELYMSSKPIKEIAWELGYQDEHYFSRFFKIHTDISPQTYRNTVGFGRAEEG